MSQPHPILVSKLSHAISAGSGFDALIIVSSSLKFPESKHIENLLNIAKQYDSRVGKTAQLILGSGVCGGRIIHSPTGELTRDYDDVRRFAEAGDSAISIAVKAGVTRPLLILADFPDSNSFQNALEVTFLGMCQRLWQPLEAREFLGEKTIETISEIGLHDKTKTLDINRLKVFEIGRRLTRDLCGTEPERMSPIGLADYCLETFINSAIDVKVLTERSVFSKDFPLFDAVARASYDTPQHHPRIIQLSYQGEGPVNQTLMLAGKAVTYDTGGVDIKYGGNMSGMSRDKGGGAAVAGFMKIVGELKPKGLKVVAVISAVKNAIGSNAYVSDEIVTAHSGKRVRISNTDAEGRLAMADALSHLRTQAETEINPCLISVATLTGHALLSYGPYSALIENGTSRGKQIANKIAEHGELWGDPCEVSLSRREDWEIIKSKTKAEDILSSSKGPSTSTVRGHQFPMAFLCEASGLSNNEISSKCSIPYVHIDISGSAVESLDWQHGKPTGSPVLALASAFIED
jgi:leucyl aminopeptidase